MKVETVAFLKDWFEQHVKTFYSEDEDMQLHVRLKEEHTWQVLKHASAIGTSLGLSSEDMCLAQTAALFHDIGRFRQYQSYHTFSDARSVNHAALGVQVLKETNILKEAALSEKEQAWIEKAILYHNQRYLPEEEDKRSLLFGKILRDADKLDIYRIIVHGEMPCSPELERDRNCSDKIVQDILAGKMARFEDVQTAGDQMLFRLSWLYNIYFRYTFLYILEQHYIEKMVATLPETSRLEAVSHHLQCYAQRQI